MQNPLPASDLVTMQLGLAASPVISFGQAGNETTSTGIGPAAEAGSFTVMLDMTLQYDLINRALNGLLAGKRITLSEGLFSNHIVVKKIDLRNYKEDQLLVTCQFTGSFTGTVFIAGKPVYNNTAKSIDMQNVDYDLQTKNLLLKGAKWLLAGLIEKELKKAASISLITYFKKAQTALEEQLNREWTTGITAGGKINSLQLNSITALPGHLLIQAECTGNLHIKIAVNNLSFLR